jgi:hypothetical protein
MEVLLNLQAQKRLVNFVDLSAMRLVNFVDLATPRQSEQARLIILNLREK